MSTKTPVWKIKVGYVGPTDACLVLIHPNGNEKEALIESEAWKCLEFFHYRGTEFTVCSTWAAPLKLIWEKANFHE